MGFAIGGSAFWGLYGPNTTVEQANANYEQRAASHEAATEKEKADEALARYTFWLTFFTGVLAFATVGLGVATIGLYLAGEKQIAVGRQSADAAKKSADASLVALRPWISCKVEIAGPLTYTTTGDAQFEVRFIVRNVGHSPAFGVRLTPFLNLLSTKHEQSILILQRMAQHNRDLGIDATVLMIPGGIPMGGAELGLILFPRETHRFNYRIPIRRGEIEKSFEDIRPNRHFFPEVFGLVAYTYPLADVRADTGFICSLENRSPDSKSGLAFELDEPVRHEYMRVADHSLWGGFAT
jgi:hypothetical protein